MIIIVTGGAGFIGSNFIFHMLETYPDYRIICLDKLTYAGNLSTLKSVMDDPRFRFVNFVNFAAAVETEDNDIVGYKVWEGAASDEPANWTSVTQDPADPRILVDGLALSTGDGTKTINAKILCVHIFKNLKDKGFLSAAKDWLSKGF